MKASELRIGNFVYQEQTVDDLEILEVKCSLSFLISLETVINALSLKPIPLTEEWLVKFGFDKTTFDYIDHYELNNIILSVFDNGIFEGGYDKKIEFVHQLQNLYFALIGEELTIKE